MKPGLTLEIIGKVCDRLQPLSLDLREAYLDHDIDRLRELAGMLSRLSFQIMYVADILRRDVNGR